MTAKLETLVDPFDELNLSLWTPYAATPQDVAVVNGQLVMTADPVAATAEMDSVAVYDLTDSQLVVQLAHAAPGTGTVQFYVQNYAAGRVWTGFSVWTGPPTLLFFDKPLDAGGEDDTITITYDPVAHNWLRLRIAGGNLLWETSPNNVNWTTQKSKTPGRVYNNETVIFWADGNAVGVWDNLNPAGTILPPPDIPPGVDVGLLMAEISSALNDLGDSTAQPDPRIAPAVALLSKINSEWASNQAQAVIDANSLAVQINALLASHPSANRLADAADCAEQLAGTWSGDDYV